MNQATFRGVALLLVAVACVALGVGYNAFTLGNDGAKVDAAQVPSMNTTAQPETPSKELKQPESNLLSSLFFGGVAFIGVALGIIFNSFFERLGVWLCEYLITKIPGLLKAMKLLKRGWPCLASAVLSAGVVWGIYMVFIDKVLAYLLWGTLTATMCFTIRGACRQAKKHVEERRYKFIDLSDAAVELIVAALEGDKRVQVRGSFLLVTPLKNDSAFLSDIVQRPANSVILDELVTRNLLCESDNVYYVTDYAKKNQNALIERDDERIIKALYGPGKYMLRQAPSRDYILRCRMIPYDRPLAVEVLTPEFLPCCRHIFEISDILDAVILFDKNRLIDYWFCMSDIFEPDVTRIGFNRLVTVEKLKERSLFLHEGFCEHVAARLTERGFRIAQKLQASSEKRRVNWPKSSRVGNRNNLT